MGEYDGHDQESTPEQIEEAISQGWVDNPEHPKYKTAADFLAVGEKIAPIVAKHAKELDAKLSRIKEDHQRQLLELRGDIFKQERAGYERALKEIQAKKERAYQDEDVDELRRLDKQAAELAPPAMPQQREQEPDMSEFMAWRAKEPWYMNTNDPEDMAKSGYADAILAQTREEVIALKGTYTTNTDVYNAIAEKVKERFGGGKRRPNQTVEGGGGGVRTTGKKDYSSLPKEIRAAAESGILKKYFGGNKEEYAKAYYAENGDK